MLTKEQIDREREEFEKWLLHLGLVTKKFLGGNEYLDQIVQSMWKAVLWRAERAAEERNIAANRRELKGD